MADSFEEIEGKAAGQQSALAGQEEVNATGEQFQTMMRLEALRESNPALYALMNKVLQYAHSDSRQAEVDIRAMLANSTPLEVAKGLMPSVKTSVADGEKADASRHGGAGTRPRSGRHIGGIPK